ncbi:arylsulfatase [Robertkochia marina]|uniref:Arylsulfatase n=1 Tax=Robertkochia marina TaxID=1227945 RepID=A0A4S3M3Y2_9FLAO|nr:arylsulfatase [Robertkochia marina]THD68857.1 arylsulfatase [Robertkochia marina]TRZ43932.1 arylsulfatase [Robertkochia marina]
MKKHGLTGKCLMFLLFFSFITIQAQDKPNILVIWGDDVGWYNISAYNLGTMGYQTPNIDRIAKEGALFTDWYAQQSCTAGRAAFILGQHPFRTGLLTIGMPGAKQGIQDNQPTIAELLKPHGYVSGQFGKNHLGDRDEHLPTNHGFDEFFGNLYHLNAEEEPESYYYPRDNKEFLEKYSPRGVLHSYGDGRIEDTGPLTIKRMETADDEFTDAAIAFIEKAHADGKPFFVWLSATRMHVWTHLKEESQGVTGIGLYPDGMVEHDKAIGRVLAKLEELGIIDNTIIMYSTDNGAEKFTWPDGGTTPFAGEKGTTWEGGFRVPCAIRWPGVIEPGTIYNDIFSHEDMMPTLVAAAGEPEVKEKLLNGYKAAGKEFNVHLDGYNMMPYFKGEVEEAPRKGIFYFDAGGNLNAIRYNNWKVHFTIMEGAINEAYRKSPSWPIVVNLRADPFEVGWEAALYTRWYADNMWLFVPAQELAAKFLATFEKYPPVKGGSLSIDKVVQQLQYQPSRN